MDSTITKELSKKTLIIVLGRVSTQFISFFLLPLYTSLLTRDEYGTVDAIMALVQLMVPVVSVMIDQGVFRYLLNCHSEEEKKKTISSAFFALTVTSVVICVIYFIVNIFVSHSYSQWLLLIIIATAFSNLFLQVTRGLGKTKDYALGSFVCSSSTIVLNVICIVFLRMGTTGMLSATFVGNAVCCLFLFLKLRIWKYLSMSFIAIDVMESELKYSFPLIPNEISLWIMNSSDRMIVTFVLGAAANGILAVSHKFSAIFLAFFNMFLLVWHEIGTVHFFDEDRDVFFSSLLERLLSLFSTVCIGAIVVIPILFNLLVNKNYNDAYYNIPIYLVAFLFNVIIGILGVVYVATKNTAEIAKTTLFAAVINVCVHLALINVIGLYAASISTVLGYGITMIYRIVDTKKYIRIQYNIKQLAQIGVALLFSCVVYYMKNVSISIIVLPLFAVLAYFINKDTVKDLIKSIDQKNSYSSYKKLFIMLLSITAIVIASVIGVSTYKHFSRRQNDIQKKFVGEINELEAKNVVTFSSFGSYDFTCTGLTFDSNDDAIWIGDYGAVNDRERPKPRVIEVDRDFNRIIREIDLEGVLDTHSNLQGIAYDADLDCLWLAVGDSVVALNKDGQTVSVIQLGEYAQFSANGICYSSSDDTIWVLCASRYLLHYDKDGFLLAEISFDFNDQDHLCLIDDCLFVTMGADYHGRNNFLCKVNMNNGDVESVFRLSQANSIEGVCYIDGKLVIANDGLYHSDPVGHSYFTVYEGNKILD